MRTRKRSLSLLLCGALLFSLCPQTASAVSIPKTGAESSGLCEHHTEHNADCGYTEGIEETPCNHEHTEDCYTLAALVGTVYRPPIFRIGRGGVLSDTLSAG